MRTFLRLILFLTNSIGFSQEKNCYSVNVPPIYCDPIILSEKNDTITCMMTKEGQAPRFDYTKDVTWVLYSADTSTLLEIISYYGCKQTKSHTVYYPNGKLKSQTNYLEDELVGPYLTFYETGAIECSGTHVNGHFIGTTYKYWDNGKVAEINFSTETSYYRKYVSYYDPSGNTITETEFKAMWNCN